MDLHERIEGDSPLRTRRSRSASSKANSFWFSAPRAASDTSLKILFSNCSLSSCRWCLLCQTDTSVIDASSTLRMKALIWRSAQASRVSVAKREVHAFYCDFSGDDPYRFELSP
jgi:hypothetical protein